MFNSLTMRSAGRYPVRTRTLTLSPPRFACTAINLGNAVILSKAEHKLLYDGPQLAKYALVRGTSLLLTTTTLIPAAFNLATSAFVFSQAPQPSNVTMYANFPSGKAALKTLPEEVAAGGAGAAGGAAAAARTAGAAGPGKPAPGLAKEG